MRYVLPGCCARSPDPRSCWSSSPSPGRIALAALGDWLGFSNEVGAFLAGVSLASTPYRDAIGARLVSLRDFLLLFFFIDLGARLDFTDAGQQIPAAAIVLSAVRPGRQPADRHRDHGRDGLPSGPASWPD